ncbi:hypothetical protein ACEWY4_019961 [Coilia grayii]|uniref:Peptide-N-glycosidase F N-terminal domain-containing protein n=1 Tax=Coilia grayii TaxID=363190 RepID=A0ABD1JB79_9TELE
MQKAYLNFVVIVCLLSVLFQTQAYSSPKQLRRSHNLDKDRCDVPLFSQTINLKSQRKHNDNTGFEPGDNAAPFEIKTLDGVFTYPLQNNWSVIIHAFTNKSAFLECLWSSGASLTDLVEYLPDNTHALFLSLDDSAAKDALWMREQVYHVASGSRRGKEVLSRLHFSPIPVFALGTWIPKVLYSWGCTGHNCGLAQAVFTCTEWDMPLIVKRLDARYDWLNGRWDQAKTYRLQDGGNGCAPTSSVAGAVAWVAEGECSFFTKVKNMAASKAVGVLVYTSAGQPIKDMNCIGEECYTGLGIPAAMVHLEYLVVRTLWAGIVVSVSFQTTPSPNFFFGIDHQGVLSETGWFLYPTFRFLSWQAQWFDYQEVLRGRLQRPATVVPVFDRVQMQGDKGAQATVDLPTGGMDYDVLELDASLSCPGRRDETCAHWDHTVQLFVCCNQFSPYCNTELGRWITAFRRGIGRWITDVSPLLPLLSNGRCAFTMKTVPWAMPWVVSLNLRFSHSNQSVKEVDDVQSLQPYKLTSLFGGGTFDKNYNSRFQPLKFTVPASTKKVELYAVITGHGSDEYGCGEFCVTSHHFLVNGVANNTRVFDTAGTALGCALRVAEGAVPNEHGTWLYGRGGWCDGLQVDPWRVDITRQLNLTGSNSILYFGLYDGMDPNPASNPGYIVMSSFLVFYK